MNLLTFEETRERVKEFMNLVETVSEPEYILQNIILPEMRNYYTPNIPLEEDDYKVYIKSKIFEIEIDENALPFSSFKISVLQQNVDGTQYIEAISLREFLYVYGNPEAFDVLDKIQFMINNEDWDSLKEELHPKPEDMKYMDYDDDIPF